MASPELESIFSNISEFAVYVRCMPSRRFRRLDKPLLLWNHKYTDTIIIMTVIIMYAETIIGHHQTTSLEKEWNK